jgi:hypothetical protein
MAMPGTLIRGIVWILVGAGVYGYSLATKTPIVIRGTTIPWGLVVIGLGCVFLGWDLAKARSRKKQITEELKDDSK